MGPLGRVLLAPLQAGNCLLGPFRLWAGLAWAPILLAKPGLRLSEHGVDGRNPWGEAGLEMKGAW